MVDEDVIEFLRTKLDFFDALSANEKQKIRHAAYTKQYKQGGIFLHGGAECSGLIVVRCGTVRVFTVSDKGKEITLYRLYYGDVCILSANCMLNNIDFSVSLSFDADSEVIIIPATTFDEINKTNVSIQKFALDLVSSRFSDVMWTLQQYVFVGTAGRLARLLEEKRLFAGSNVLEITHEQIANEVGSAREVITRLLKKLQEEKIVALHREKIEILDEKALSLI